MLSRLTAMMVAVVSAVSSFAEMKTETLTFTSDGGTKKTSEYTAYGSHSFVYSAPPAGSWVLSPAQSLSIKSSGGVTETTVSYWITVDANPTAAERSWTMKVTDNGTEFWNIKIVQSGKLVSNFGFPTSVMMEGSAFAGWSFPLQVRLINPTGAETSFYPMHEFYEGESPWAHLVCVNFSGAAIQYPSMKFELYAGAAQTPFKSYTVAANTSAAIAAGNGKPYYVQLSALGMDALSQGEYKLKVTLDPDSQLADPDRSDNVAEFSFDVLEPVPFVLDIDDGVLSGYGYQGRCPAKLVIPDTVREIADGAFCYCDELEELVLPPSVTKIGGFAFCGCARLGKITFAEGLEEIGWSAFEQCSSLGSIDLPVTLKSVGPLAFVSCENLKSVVLRSPATVLDSTAFTVWKKTSLIDWIFEFNSGLTSVSLQNDSYELAGWRLTAKGSADKSMEKDFAADDLGAFKVYADNENYNPDAYYVVQPIVRGIPGLGFPEQIHCTGTPYAGWEKAMILSANEPDPSSLGSYLPIAGYQAGAQPSVHFLLANFGSEAISSSFDCLFEALDSSGAVVAEDTVSAQLALPAGQMHLASMRWAALSGLSAGSYVLRMTLDPLKKLSDSDRSNNVATYAFEVTEPPAPTVSITFHSNDSHNWNFGFGGFEVGKALGTPSGLTSITGQTGFLGWFTAADGGTPVTAETPVTKDMTDLYAHWATPAPTPTVDDGGNPGSTPEDKKAEYERQAKVKNDPERTIFSIDYDLGGGVNAAGNPTAYSSEAGLPLTLAAPTREGYLFKGWALNGAMLADGVIAAGTQGDLRIAAVWELPLPGEPVVVEKAKVLSGCVMSWGEVVGTVQVKLGRQKKDKATGARSTKLSAIVTGMDGKKKTSGSVSIDLFDDRASQAEVEVKDWGKMSITIAGDKFSGTLGEYDVQSDAIGGDWTVADAGATVIPDDSIDLIPGDVQDWLLPYDEPVIAKKGKWSFAKAASVKWAKDKETGDYDLIVDDKKGKNTNYSGLKLTYMPKTGAFKGSFKLYSLEETSSGKTKLKKYTVNVSGAVVGGVGYGTAVLKKFDCKWPVRVE